MPFRVALALAIALQTAPAPPESASDILLPRPDRGPAVLISGTPVVLVTAQELNSATLKEGDVFALSVAHDVMAGNRVAIPAGTAAQGRIVWREGKGGWGKAAKLGFAIEWLEIHGRRVPLSGSYRAAGKRNDAGKYVGLVGIFVTGKSATVKAGQEFVATTRDPLPIEPAPR